MKLVNESGFIGLIIAYLISWRISLKRNWFWVNSVLVFLVAYYLKRLSLLGWSSLQVFFLAPGHLFSVNSVWSFLTNGLFMLTIGSLLLFLKPVIRFIEKGIKTDKNAFQAK
jgi:hypothetical protein